MLAALRPLLASLASTMSIACVAAGTGETDRPSPTLAAGCEGEAPACIMGCSTRAYIERARCDEGVWSCEAGVRHDLCCDPIHMPEQCPEFGEQCDLDHPCKDGFTCVVSRTWPLPAEAGVCRLGDWSIPTQLGDCARDDVLDGRHLASLGPAAVKLEGVVAVEPSCDDRRCQPDNPCCQRCTGAYALDLDGDHPMRITLRTETVSCLGSNCGFTCAPLQPGRRYRIWGLWVPDDGGTALGALYVAGSCDD